MKGCPYSACDPNSAISVRWRLQRRMFLWFGATILLTLLVVTTVTHMVGGRSPGKDVARFKEFVADQFALVWDQPAQRDALARSMSERLDLGVQLLDAQGNQLSAFGRGCARPLAQLGVGGDKGQILLCSSSFTSHTERLVLALLVAGCVLWAASGAIARRLSRPVVELARVAQDLGAGKLDSRVRIDGHNRGEVHVLAHALNDMAERIEKQMADQRALLATVSHEIRTPLARMRILVEMARDSHDPKTLDKIDAEAIEIDQLVSELLASSRLDFSALAVAPLDARKVATDALERAGLDPTLLSFEAQNPFLRGDPTLVARAVLNLLENARRHGGGATAVRVFDADGLITFEVHDEGPGLAPGDEEKIFLPFYKGRHGDGRSVGLGLALVRRIAQAHGGATRASNHPDGRGACVSVSFAAEPAPEPAPASVRAPRPALA